MTTTEQLAAALERARAVIEGAGLPVDCSITWALAAYNSAQKAEGADEHGIRAFAAYLKDCEECAIVPDVAGAFNSGRQAGHESGRQQGMAQERALWEMAKAAQESGMYDDALCRLAASSAQEPSTALEDLISEHLTCLYACTRVWEAWSVGTMTEDDFVPASETEFAADLANEIHAKFAAPARLAGAAQGEAVVHVGRMIESSSEHISQDRITLIPYRAASDGSKWLIIRHREGDTNVPLLHWRDWQLWNQLHDLATTHPQAPAATQPEPLQQRVQPWLLACFGAEIASDKIERNHRFLEEALELVQACGCTQSEAHQLVDYTFGRPAGEPHQEAGGVMITLAALCLANGLDMHAAAETELARIWTKVDQIRAKQAAKPKHSPLPEPVAVAAEDAQMQERLDGLLGAIVLGGGIEERSRLAYELRDIIDGRTTLHPAPAVAAEAGQGEREAFEAVLRDKEQWGHYSFGRFKDGDYKSLQTAFAWSVWQARASISTQPAQPLSETKPKSLSAAVADSLRPYMSAGQKVIWREAFRWKDDNGVMSNHYECMSVRALAEDFRYEVIEDCGCAAIIQPAGNGKAGVR